jgi:hypothetical protein
MVLLCVHRHQSGAVSRDKGTLRHRALTGDEFRGPVAWEVHRDCFSYPQNMGEWIEVARERTIGELEPLETWQRTILENLAEMKS